RGGARPRVGPPREVSPPKRTGIAAIREEGATPANRECLCWRSQSRDTLFYESHAIGVPTILVAELSPHRPPHGSEAIYQANQCPTAAQAFVVGGIDLSDH